MKPPTHVTLHSLFLLVGLAAVLASQPGRASSLPFDSLSNGCPFCGGSGLPTPEELGLVPPPADKAKPATTPSTPSPNPVAATARPQPSIPKAGPLPEIKQGADGYWRVSFLHLASFEFTAPPVDAPHAASSLSDIPQSVRQLDGKRVALSGYMLPLKMDKGLVKEFLLIRSPMVCCYGITPAPNEWVVVKMKGPGTAAVMDTPLNFYGTLRVGEIYEDNMFAGIYQLDGERVSVD